MLKLLLNTKQSTVCLFVGIFVKLFLQCLHSAVSQQGQVAPRTGFMYNFHQKETLIKVWDPVTEGIVQFMYL